MKKDKVKNGFYIIVSIITILTFLFGLVTGIDKYFAKESQVQKVEERLDLKIQDDKIYYQEQQIQRTEAYNIFKIEPTEPSVSEKAMLEKQKQELEKLKKGREEIIQKHESKR